MAYLGFCPPGVVFPYAGSTAPEGWLLCEGQAVSRTVYAALFAAIGVAHGYGDNSTTFNLPDYRGRFLRGRDNGVARDPDRAARTASNTGGNAGDNVGSIQVNATKSPNNSFTGTAAGQSVSVSGNRNQFDTTGGSHDHGIPFKRYYWGDTRTGNYEIPSSNSVFIGDQPLPTNAASHSHAWSGTFSASGSGSASALSFTGGGDNETRPVNINVNYIIKI